MLKVSRKRRRKEKRRKLTVGIFAVLTVFCCFFLFAAGLKTGNLMGRIGYDLAYLMLQEYTPMLAGQAIPTEYEDTDVTYETQTESELKYEQVLAKEAAGENDRAVEEAKKEEEKQESEEKEKTVSGQTSVSLEKLNDFDYLIQKFYTVDKTTTINSSQLNAKKLLAKDCSITKTEEDKPQILIYHTHSQEGYRDSKEGDLSTTVVAVGDKLTELLEEKYGYHVLHHKGTYDVGDRNYAYNRAAPELEKILENNPSIEVVIDLHRDGVGEDTRLVTEIDGKKTAQIMFFNGLSKSTSTGEIDYLRNPYIQDNLAFSLQMQIAAAELYPGFTRKIYLKSYRYNMHFCPKSLLIEVGAQTNTLEEAMNAMEPLAAVLDKVLDK